MLSFVAILPLLILGSCNSFCYAFQPASLPAAPQQRLSTGRRSTTLKEHTLNIDENETDDFIEQDGPKAQLLEEIGAATATTTSGAPVFGFGDNDDDAQKKVSQLVDDLSGYVLPLEPKSSWKLLYTSAPDVLGFRGGPLSQLVTVSIEQETGAGDDQKLNLSLEYKPSDNMASLVGSFLENVGDDRLVQTVEFGVTQKPMNKFDLAIKGTSIESSRLPVGPSLPAPFALPFIGFTIVFNDGNLRVDRSIQGDFLSVYKRI